MYIKSSKKTNRNGKVSISHAIVESYRKEGKVRQRKVLSLSGWSQEDINALQFAFNHKKEIATLLELKGVEVKQGKSIGAIFVLYAIAKQLGIAKALGYSRNAKLCLWMIIARLIQPGLSRTAMVRLTQHHAVMELLNIDEFTENDLYKAMDWVEQKQSRIEISLFKMKSSGNPPSLYLYDVTSSYFEGTENELAEFGYNRDKKRGKKQIVIGLLADGSGEPISVEVFKGNTNDLSTFRNQVVKLIERFNCKRITVVGDRGMIKSSQIEDLNKNGFNYITGITKPQIRKLINQGSFQVELFTDKLIEVVIDDVRYILRKNPVRAKEIKKDRDSMMNQIKNIIEIKNKYLEEHPRAVEEVALRKIEEKISKFHLTSFMKVKVENRKINLEFDAKQYEYVSQLDGCYVLKSDLQDDIKMDEIHDRYKDLISVEKGFRTIKTGYLEVRPIYLRKENRTRAHVFLTMLSYKISRYIEQKLKELEFNTKECVSILSSICSLNYDFNDITFKKVPVPSNICSKILERLDITFPKEIPTIRK